MSKNKSVPFFAFFAFSVSIRHTNRLERLKRHLNRHIKISAKSLPTHLLIKSKTIHLNSLNG